MSGSEVSDTRFWNSTEGPEFLCSLYEHASVGIEYVAPDGRLLMANAALCHMLGYGEGELLGKRYDVIVPPEDRPREAKLLDKVLAGQYKCVDIEKRFLHRSGAAVWAIVSSLPVSRGVSAPYCISIVRDVTDVRDVTEPRLARAHFELALEAALTAMVLVREDGAIIFADSHAEELFGYRLGELLQQSVEILLSEKLRGCHPRLRGQFFRHPEDQIMGGARELTGHRKDGTQIPVEVNFRSIEVEDHRWVLASIVDIGARKKVETAARQSEDRLRGTAHNFTERRKTVEALRESEERFRTIANSAPVMIWMSGTDKLRTYFNKPWLEFTGRTMEAELGNGWAEGVHPDDLENCTDAYSQSVDRREPFRMEYRLKRHDGEYRWIIDIAVPRLNADGSSAGYIGSCVDDTDRRLAEEALRALSRSLIHAQEEERKRIARELHDDINQRLAMLAVELQQLQKTPRLSASRRNERIDKLFKYTTEIACEVQALSHRLHSASLEYLGLVPALQGFCDEMIRHQNVEIDFQHRGVPKSIPQDVALALFRVTQEALHNAVKHSGVCKFGVRLFGTAHEIQLSVRDSGVGFSPEAAMPTRGLGLISMRERILPLKGRISVVSKPGQGTEITVRVPVEKAA